ncbi:uncharacterized protein [Amphiura filiformis]|uniref:uncharacterized protein n=1 Tax=Amphiura filiformis TaxID=82378 RepID=UPI003B21318B
MKTGPNKPQYGKRLNQTLIDLANDNMLVQMQHIPTRGENILDLVFTNIPDQLRKVETVPGISDHDAVIVQLDTTVKYIRRKPRKVYLYKKGDMDGLRDEMESYKESLLQSNPMERDVETNWTSFKDELFSLMDKHIPQKQLSSWMNNTIKREIRKKKRLWKKAKRNNTEKNWDEFKEMRKKVKSSMKKAYEDYVGNILEDTMQDSHKKFWQFINNQKKDSTGIPPLKTDRGLATDSAAKAEALNKQYQSVYTQEDTSSFPDMGPSPYTAMPDINFTTNGIEKLLSKLNPRKACGPDLVPIRILKETAEQIAPILQVIFTQSYNTGSFPVDWHGFRQGHSTESQLIVTLEEIARSLDSNTQTDVLILDFSKAFDTVAHQRLIKKIDYYGIRDKTNGWIKTWLTNRTQRVVVEDDCLLFRTIKTPADANQLQEDLNSLDDWSHQWQMRFNAKKCYTMRIHRKKKPITHQYIMGKEELSAVSSQAYLGVEIHEQLSWKPHIEAVASKAGKTLGFIRRNLGKYSSIIKTQAYTSLVRSQLEYASVVWDPHKQNQIDQLEMIQRRAVRFICGNYSREASVTAMRQDLGIPTLEERCRQARLTMFYKVVNQQIAIPIPNYIQTRTRSPRSSQHQRFMRLGSNSNSDTYKHSFFTRTVREWDALPQAIIELPTIEQFKGAISRE